ncbi:MAG: hypothetical protein MI757_22250 [Pirellulales bacterium]|nr:hypothetical protein [Pirellulales bacterium]
MAVRDQLRSELDVATIILDENDPAARDWLAKFNLPELAAEYPRGSGTYVWLEDGLFLDYELRPLQTSPAAIVAKTHRYWGGRFQRPIQSTDMIGKTILKILQTPWEHSEDYSNCDFYILLTDGTLFEALLSGNFVLVDQRSTFASMLIEVDTDYPAFYSSDGFSGIDAHVFSVNRICESCTTLPLSID